jgi:2'-5' RNA ligase
MSLFTSSLMASGQSIQEYGIVIIPEEKCIKYAIQLNNIIAKNLPNLENVHNNWHITLYHGAYDQHDLLKIKSDINLLNYNKFDIKFNKFYITADRWVDWGVEKTETLQFLHESMVKIGSKYHKRPLDRARDIYNDVDSERKAQIDKYGVSGVMNLYNPHMTLFYTYPADSSIQETLKMIENPKYNGVTCSTSKLALGKLGYNGNITEIMYTIE